MHPACNAHAPCCLPWAARLYHVFPHYVIKGTILERLICHKRCILIFSTILSEIFLILSRNERDVTINVHGLHVE
jgi:hypothetical protein